MSENDEGKPFDDDEGDESPDDESESAGEGAGDASAAIEIEVEAYEPSPTENIDASLAVQNHVMTVISFLGVTPTASWSESVEQCYTEAACAMLFAVRRMYQKLALAAEGA